MFNDGRGIVGDVSGRGERRKPGPALRPSGRARVHRRYSKHRGSVSSSTSSATVGTTASIGDFPTATLRDRLDERKSKLARTCVDSRAPDRTTKRYNASYRTQTSLRSREGKNPSLRSRASRSVCGEFAAGTCRRRAVQLAHPDANITPELRFLN